MKKRISTLKIKQLLSMSFGILLVILLLLGLTSITYIHNISGNTEVLYERPHTNLVGMWEAKSRISQTGNGLREMILYNIPPSADLTANLMAVEQVIRDIEGNKVDKTAPMSDNMKNILAMVDAWSSSGQQILEIVNSGQIPSGEQVEQYTKLEQDAINGLDAIIATAADNALKFKNTAMESASASRMVLCFIFGAAFMLTILMLGILRKRIISPIYVLLESAEKIEQGNLEEEIPYVSRDEFGELADSFRQMQASLKDVIMDVKTNLERMGGNDFCVEIHADYRGEFEMIRESMEAISDHLSMALLRINESADQVAAGAQMLSQGATEQASSVEELAATINELTSHVAQNADSASNATRTAEEVKDYAVESGKRMAEMLEAISNISDRSKEIGKIIKTIEDIAFQTNILALNAAVEAARAGEAGKGFAVVADEVRNLAGKSAEASNNTAEMIKESLKAVENGAVIADETAQSLKNVVEGVQGITQAIEDISASSGEQASSLSQVTIGIDQISSVVQTTSATAEESAASSEELSDQARKLKELVGQFRLKKAAIPELRNFD
ncbi:MAG: HAMP domain-containing protein [Clostridiales bacterium]|nr:HAMP domain-containing protein [Clostridiales bacterium]